MIYNLNFPVKVKLTTRGISVLENYRKDQIEKYGKEFEHYNLLRVDKDGWTRFESVAELFEIFGGYLWYGNEPFNMYVDFCGEENK
jgi:hypothetical protein